MLRVLVFFLCVFACRFGLAEDLPSHRAGIVVENRILASVRGETITVIDVLKKMDMVFRQQFSQYRHVPEARCQFYRQNWQNVLNELVDRQLILSFSEEKHFGVTNGDVREEMEEMFGPNMMMNLYEDGLSLNEVFEMVKADILLRRALSFYVHGPVLASITPEVLRAAYSKRVEQIRQKQGWVWRAVTVKSTTGDCPKDAADHVWKLLEQDHQSLEILLAGHPEGIEVSVSQPFRSEQQEVSPNVRQILEGLAIGSFSEPQATTSRSDNHQSWRCYTVDDRIEPTIPLFTELEPALREEIAAPQISKRTVEFFDDLKKQYHVKHLLSSEQLTTFEPFVLKSATEANHASVPSL